LIAKQRVIAIIQIAIIQAEPLVALKIFRALKINPKFSQAQGR